MNENIEITSRQYQEDSMTTRPIETITNEIQYYKTQVGSGIIEIGKRLIEAKRVLPQGEWLPYIKDKIEFSERTAQNFMRLSKEYANPQAVADLGAAKAVLLLALTPEEREGFIESTHVVDGEEKTINEISKREIERLTKEIIEERRKSETLQFDFDTLNTENEEEQLLANEQLERLKKELEELKNQEPPTVIAELDESTMLKVKNEAQAEAAAEFAKKEKELEKKIQVAEKIAMKAEEVADKKEREAATAQQQSIKLKESLEKAEKDLLIIGSPEITVFKVNFENCKLLVNAMYESIDKLEESGNHESAQKLISAISALRDNMSFKIKTLTEV